MTVQSEPSASARLSLSQDERHFAPRRPGDNDRPRLPSRELGITLEGEDDDPHLPGDDEEGGDNGGPPDDDAGHEA
jgi:hypothetical protein